MAHSLILGREIELLGDGSMIDSGPAAGAVIRLGGIGNTNLDLGAGEPQTTVITSLLLDGERPVGKRTGNATVELPIYVVAPGIPALIAAREKVLQIVDQEIWEMVVTLEGLPSTVFDCLRAKVSMPTVLTHLQQDVCTFTVSMQRLPFGRNDTETTLTVQAPPGTPGGGGISYLPTLTFDNFDIPQGSVYISGAHWNYTTNERYGSSGTQAWYTPGAGTYQRATYGGSMNLTGYSAINFWAAGDGRKTTTRTITMTLFDNQGRAWKLPAKTLTLAPNIKYNWYGFSLKTVKPPLGYNLAAVAYYWISSDGSMYLDDMTVVDGAVNVYAGSRGGVYNIHAIEGTARTPINIDLNRPAGGPLTAGIIHKPASVPRDYAPLIQLNPVTPLDYRLITLPGTTTLTNYWDGTYNVILSIGALLGGSTLSRTLIVNFYSYHPDDSPPGVGIAVGVNRTFTPAEIGAAKYLYMGRVTFPLRDMPPDSLGSREFVKIREDGLPTGTYDQFTDLILLDAEGSTVIWQNQPFTTTHVYVDEPDPVAVNHGLISSGNAHVSAESISEAVTSLSGEALGLDPGNSSLLVHCWDGATQMTINYSPRWRGLRPN